MRRGGATRGSWRETPEEKIAGGHAAEADDVRRVRWRGDARDNREVGAGEEGRRGEGLAKGKREGKSAMRDARRATRGRGLEEGEPGRMVSGGVSGGRGEGSQVLDEGKEEEKKSRGAERDKGGAEDGSVMAGAGGQREGLAKALEMVMSLNAVLSALGGDRGCEENKERVGPTTKGAQDRGPETLPVDEEGDDDMRALRRDIEGLEGAEQLGGKGGEGQVRSVELENFEVTQRNLEMLLTRLE